MDPEEDIGDRFVRPFTMTRGRTRAEGIEVAIESIVYQSPASLTTPPTLTPVESEIWAAAAGKVSSAEISAKLGLPLGVVRVLVGDLATAGLLHLGRTTATGDAQLIRRLIDGVRAV